MSWILYILLGLLVMKLLYNFAVPYRLLKMQDEKAGISVMFMVEWLLLGMSVVLSAAIKPDIAWLGFWSLCGLGIGAIIASYLNFVLTMIVGGWFKNRRENSTRQP